MPTNNDDNKPNRINKTTFESKYPYNKVMVTESGHEFHWDDTPGKERIRIAHKSGTYTEISADGKMVNYNVGHAQSYNKGGFSLTIDEMGDIKIEGHGRIGIGGGSHIEVTGDADIVVGGDSHTVVGGNMKAAVAGDMYSGVKGNSNMNVMGSADIKVAGDTSMESGGTHTIKAGNIVLDGDIDHKGNMTTSGVHTDANGLHV